MFKLNLSKRTTAIVALVLSVVVFAGLIGAIQHYRNRPAAEQTATVFTEVTSQNFKQEILQSQVSVYVLFYVDKGCKPCDEQIALVEKVAKDYAGKVKFTKIHAQNEQQISQANGVTAVPTAFFINVHTGNITGAQGPLTEEQLRKALDEIKPAPAKDNPDGK